MSRKIYFDYGANSYKDKIEELPIPLIPSEVSEMMKWVERLHQGMTEICGIKGDGGDDSNRDILRGTYLPQS